MHKLRNDIILIVGILLISIVFILIYFSLSNKDNLVVYIYHDKQLVTEISLSENKEIEIGDLIVVIEDNYVYVKESSCDDKICVNQGKINMSGQTITCLPNRVVIKLEGKGVDVGIWKM